ncbi:DUF262 domain-containing protein [Paeniglutamicibacter sp. NPDC091659]|uniref:DUF262 domain-containing protein n=1 Tax=Paeniglutamicibacter sp. NPDC091659 TaxID=3364389 RepID=UPI003827D55C
MPYEALTPELCTVAQLFDESGSAYSVPVYQRSYAWRAEQIEQLISDVCDAVAQNADSYFLGNLVVTTRTKELVEYEVIDGQQRLTTLYLLLSFLSHVGPSSERHFRNHISRLRYESRPRSSEALRRIDGGPAATISGSMEDTGIQQGYNIIQQYMDQRVASDDRPRFTEFLLHRVHLVRASLPESTDFNRYFEIMNTRGQQLQPVDIVKARLMSCLSSEIDRNCFARVWEACAEMDTYVQGPLARGNSKLRDRLFDTEWSWLRVSSFDDLRSAFAEHAATEPGSDAQGHGMTSSFSLDEALIHYANLRGSEPADLSESERFSSTIPFTSLLLHALKLFSSQDQVTEEGGLDDKRLIELFSEQFSGDRPDRVRDFVALLLRTRVAFDSFILKREFLAAYSDEGEWSLRKVVKNRAKSSTTIGYRNTFSVEAGDDDTIDRLTRELLLLQSMLRVTYTSPRTMHWITLVLHHVLHSPDPGTVNEPDLIELLRAHVRKHIHAAFLVAEEPTGFNVPRIVFTYLDYLLLSERRVGGNARDYLFSFRTSIEHFYPQHPDEQQSGESVSSKNLHALGNLALVSVGANSKFSNSLPLAKAGNFKKTIEAQSPKLSLMAERTRVLGQWGDAEIESHHHEMVDLLRSDLMERDSAGCR